MLDTNAKGLLYMTQAAIPLLKKSKNAHIVNIGSIAGTEVYPGGNAYCASKHAVNALSKATRMELLPFGIRVSQIRPGLADTEFSVVRYKGDKQKASLVYEGYEALQAEDIARTVLFVLESPKHVCINDLEITPTAQANAYLLEKKR
jgi:NADP-dependent 3-hydroxy acid dehydrogenase YdfG